MAAALEDCRADFEAGGLKFTYSDRLPPGTLRFGARVARVAGDHVLVEPGERIDPNRALAEELDRPSDTPLHVLLSDREYQVFQLIASGLRDALTYVDAPEVTAEQLLRVHTVKHVESVAAMIPDSGFERLDPDTVVSPDSLLAAYRAAGSVVAAVDLVLAGEIDSAFCAVRPPGLPPVPVDRRGAKLWRIPCRGRPRPDR